MKRLEALLETIEYSFRYIDGIPIEALLDSIGSFGRLSIEGGLLDAVVPCGRTLAGPATLKELEDLNNSREESYPIRASFCAGKLFELC